MEFEFNIDVIKCGTECEVAFSWNTGRALHNVNIHNPHYYNRQREINNGAVPRNPGDILCGGLCDYNTLRYYILTPLQNAIKSLPVNLSAKNLSFKSSQEILDWHRFVGHMTNHELVRIRTRLNNLDDNKELRIQYILKEKNKDELTSAAFRNDTIRRKLFEISHIYEILSLVGIETFNYLCNNANLRSIASDKVLTIINDSFNEYRALVEYSNAQLQDISATFSNCVIQIDPIKFTIFKKFTFNDLEKNNIIQKQVVYH